MRTKVIRLALGAFACLLLGGPHMAVAQVFNHIMCGKFPKDTIPKATYTADEFFFGNCIIKVPAKLLCETTFKTNVNPPPPGGGPTAAIGPTTNFLCYKQKCPTKASGQFTIKDQFGTHTLNAGTRVTSNMLCTPASLAGAFLDASPLC
jgi:hypothetical protein